MSNKARLSVMLFIIALSTIACTPTNSRGYPNGASPTSEASNVVTLEVPTPFPSASPVSIGKSPIRSVDFNTVTYAHFPVYSNSKIGHITRDAGGGKPTYIAYGDVTADGVEEAMAALSVENQGSAISHYVYIFSIDRGKLTLLWAFETGDRADGGLRQVYAENGQLVIELFGKDRIIGTELYRGDEGLCCPSSFTRARYTWTGKNFQQVSKEVLVNSEGNASPIMATYQPRS
jgi:hypothetical protein